MYRFLRMSAPFAFALAITGCGDDGIAPLVPSPPAPTISGTAYLEEMFVLMERYAVHRATIDWSAFRAEVLAAAGSATTISDTYPAVGVALRLLHDHESVYRSSRGVFIGTNPDGGCTAPAVPAVRLPESIGYLRVRQSSAGQTATSLQQDIQSADRPGLAGWIVDLRGNGGGNMWPMLAGVGPVLGEGIVGWIVYNDREYEREYRDGASLSLGEAFATAAPVYRLLEPDPRVAVLTDGLVNSAGEAITVFFKGRAGVRSFGSPTCGHHHLLQEFGMSDGATLLLTTAQHADRLKRRYEGPIEPDEHISDQESAINRAVDWLLNGR